MDAEDGLPFVKNKGNGSAWVRLLKQRLPILQWAPKYDRMTAVADVVAGITLGLTLVPQSIAYASLANLPVQYGLYSAFIGTMLYVFLGTVKEVSIGPTSLMALLILQICKGLPVEFVVLLSFLSGCIVLLMGLLRLGFLVDLISPSVTSGFTSATAVIIVASQVKGLLGLSFMAESVPDNVKSIALNWHLVRTPDCILGAVCCGLLLCLRKLKDVRVHPKKTKVKKALWLISIGRNALVVILASTFAYVTYDPQNPLIKLSGRVEPGLPTLSLPPFSVVMENRTVHFVEMVQHLGSGVLMMPIVMVLANIAIAKAFSTGGRMDATQEMLTLGLCNMAGSLVHAMPTCGAFTRSAVSHSSGVRTPAAGLYSGVITLLALIFLTKYFFFIPKACLSSVLICAVVFMIDVSILQRLWRQDRKELFLLVLTFVVAIVRTVELAVLAGALASVAVLLRRLMRPTVQVHIIKTSRGEVCRVKPTLCLVYLNAEVIASKIVLGADRVCPRPVVVDFSQVTLVDYAAAQVLQRLIKKMKSSNQKMLFYNVSKDIINQLDNLEGVEKRTFSAKDVIEALNITEEKIEMDETCALLSSERNKESV